MRVMPSRRTLLKAGGLAVLTALVGRTVAYPDVRVRGGVGTLHPANERYLAADVVSDDGSLGAALLNGPDESLVGPDATEPVRGALTDDDWFHDPGDPPGTHRLVAQYRSSPDRPMRLLVSDVGWKGVWTLSFRADLSEWRPIADVEDEECRKRLRSADRLAYTSVWAVRAPVGPLPDPGVDVLTAPGR